MTKSEQVLARKAHYDRIERAPDALGRSIGVRRLKPSQQLHVQELAPGLDGSTPVVDEATGRTLQVPKSSPLFVAASVCEIDGLPITFPRSRGELDAVLDMLDMEGMAAASQALSQFSPAKAEGDEAAAEPNPTDVAKN